METNKHAKKHGSSAFFWGLVIGALLATLLTTKNGRKILKELIDVILVMAEDFTKEKKEGRTPIVSAVKDKVDDIRKEAEFKKVVEDIESEITEEEEKATPEHEYEDRSVTPVQMMTTSEEVVVEEEKSASKANGHSKKRLFRGIRKK